MPTFRIGRRTALSLALGTALAMSVALPGTAGAATAPATVKSRATAGTFEYDAAPGQTNHVSVVAKSSDGVHLTYAIDDLVPITIAAGAPCTHPDSADLTRISCTGIGRTSGHRYAVAAVVLGDGDDYITYDNGTGQVRNSVYMSLGSGNDSAIDSGETDGNEIDGGAGNDSVFAGTDALVFGDEGTDTIYVGARSNALGGTGSDVFYPSGDGSRVDAGAGDDLIYGGGGRQTLIGEAGNDEIRGGAGNDLMYGGAGNDTLLGSYGNDLMYGNQGNDTLYGNSGDDTIFGNSGNDTVYGGAGRDTLSGGPGRNVVHQD